MMGADAAIGAALAAGFGALATAIGSHVNNGNRITALEVRTGMMLDWLERVEGKLDQALKDKQTPREQPRDGGK